MNKVFPFGLLYVTACGNDNVIEKQENSAPTVTIMSHGDGAEVQDGFVEYFRAVVSDDDNEFDELTVAWYVGEELVCDWEEANLAGESTCEIVFEEGDGNVIAEVRDPQGAGGRSEVKIDVLPTEAPAVELLTPVAGNNYYSNQLIQFSALVSDLEDEPEDLIVSWTSSVDGELPLDNSINADGEISDYTYLTEGNHAIELRVEDTTGKVSTEEVVIQVGGENHEPTCGFTAPNDGDAFVVGESVIFSGTAMDEDIANSDLTVEVSSNLDGVFQNLFPNSDGSFSFATNALSLGTHTVTLSVMDEVDTECRTSILVSVGNPPLASIDEPLDGSVFSVGETVTFRGTVTDSEDQGDQIAVVWNSDIDGELQSGYANSQGVSQFTRSDLSAGVHSVSFSATDSIGLVTDELISFRVNTLPTVDSITLSPNPVYTDDNLVVTATGSDLDGQNVTMTYAWYENGTATSFNGTSISASELQVGETWTVRVTPNDGFQDGTYLEEVITISNTDPTVTTPTISPNSSIYANSQLTCAATGNDLDDGSLTPTYTWTSSGGATNTGATWQLSPSMISVSDTITCTASVTDANGATASTTSASVTVENSPPTSTGIAISPSTGVVTGSTLTCSGGFTDLEDGTLTPTYEWTVNGTIVSNIDTYTVSANDTNVGDSVECTASVTDSHSSTVTDTTSVTVDNSTPTVGNESISTGDGGNYNTSTYTCGATVTDIDDNSSTTYTWSVGGTEIGNGTDTLDAATEALLPGDVLVCIIEVTDADTGVSTSQSTSITLDNRAPTTPTATITWSGSGNTPTDSDDLTCTGSGSTDPDGESVSYIYTWTSSGGANVSGSTVLSSSISGSETWTCSAVATDGTASSSEGTDSVTIDSGCGLTNCDSNLDLGGGVSMDMVLISSGSDPQGRYDITSDFYVMTTEVTQGMYTALMSYDPTTYSTTYGVGNDYPVYYVNWYMAADFANKVTQRHNSVNGTNLQECYSCSFSDSMNVSCTETATPYQCTGYRMLTEAEWEYAARSGTQYDFWTSNGGGDLPGMVSSTTTTLTDGSDLSLYAWYTANNNRNGNPYGSKEVATREPNDFGLYDMHGNIFEWTTDWGGCSFPQASSDPHCWYNGPNTRVKRGGSWDAPPDFIQALSRHEDTIQTRGHNIGFRLALGNPTQPTAASIAIANQSPEEGVDDLYCEILVDSTDPQGDAITYTFDWTVDGSTYNGTPTTTVYSGDTIPASETVAGEVWECTVTPNDGTEDGDASVDSVTIDSGCGLTNCDINLDLGGGQSLDFVLIPGGTDPKGRYTLTSDFYLMTTEVTQGMFNQIMGYESYDGKSTTNGSGNSHGVGNDYPAYYVSWDMAADFANHVTQQHNSVNGTSLQECYSCSNSGNTSVSCTEVMNPYQCSGYVLPTEAEWEYAARSGTQYEFWTPNGGGNYSANSCGNTIDDVSVTIQDGSSNPPALSEYAWFCGNRFDPTYTDSSKPVGLKLPNGFGLYDMHGNMREMTADWHGCSFPESSQDPFCAVSGSNRVIRSGYYLTDPLYIRSSARAQVPLNHRTYYFGFRLGLHP